MELNNVKRVNVTKTETKDFANNAILHSIVYKYGHKYYVVKQDENTTHSKMGIASCTGFISASSFTVTKA
jgi:Zn-dependent M32 family carboxypeptidase